MGISPIRSKDRPNRIVLCRSANLRRSANSALAALSLTFTLLCVIPASARPSKSHLAQQHTAKLTPWEQAEQNREALEAIPAGARTHAEYDHALDSFRAIYHQSPGDLHAAASVYAVAELLAEQGREPHDGKVLQSAVGQYEFLRKQYPGSSLRIPALLAEAQLEANDLHDAKAARERYRLLLKQYPRSEQAEEAKAGIAALNSPRPDLAAPVVASASSTPAPVPYLSRALAASTSQSQPTAIDAAIPSPLDGAKLPPAAQQPVESGPHHEAAHDSGHAAAHEAREGHEGHESHEGHNGRLAQVTGIRHWSTPTYTRVAIDLGDDVTFEAARVPNPDRIYFDLHGTRLAQELVGKSFAVTDDGFLKKIRAAQFSNDMTRVVLDVNDVSEYSAFLLPNPYRLIIDIHGGVKPLTATAAGVSSLPELPVTSVPAPRAAISARVTTALPVPNTVTTRSASNTEIASLSQAPGRVDATSRPTSQPIASVVAPAAEDRIQSLSQPAAESAARHRPAIARSNSAKLSQSVPADPAPDAVPARAATPTADGETSLVRALGLKIGRIVIDAGHGGHDSGTLGVGGIEEKDVVLDVALRLGKLLHDRLGAEIIYTRSDDTFIPLEDRTAIANKAQADLFLSIHANSSSDPTARGVETYYLNFTSSPDALETAARENAVSTQSIHQLSDLVKKITLKDKIDESREFASDVEQSLYTGLERGNGGLKNRGVKKAPFVVLIGANMPSILAEISFVTNPRDAGELQRPEYRERVAESLYKGVARYESGLSGIQVPTLRASAATTAVINDDSLLAGTHRP